MITKKDLAEKVKIRKLLFIWAFPFIIIAYFIRHLMTAPAKRPGIQAICGDTGAGKTFLAYMLAVYWSQRGYKIYSNSKFCHLVNEIKIDDHYSNFQIKKPMKNGVFFFEEVNREFNRRLNKRNDYNEVFVPMIDDILTHRHNNVPAVYMITQSWDKLDSQLQSIVHRVNFVWSRKKPSFKAWMKSKRFRPSLVPKKITYISRKRKEIERDDFDKYVKKGDIKYRPIRKYGVKVSLDDLVSFNTYAYKNRQSEDKEKAEK